jgi:hypothetical protein
MTNDQVAAILPPIALSLGAILPFLIASPPFAVASNARVLLVCIMTVVIWMGYWMAYLLGEWAFYSLFLTVGLITAAFVLFICIFRAAQLAPIPKISSNGTFIKDAAGQPITEAAIDRPAYLWLYLAGLILVSVAAALYVGPQGRVIVEFEIAGVLNQPTPVVQSVSRDIGSTSYVTVDHHIRSGKALCMMTKAEYERVSQFVLEVDPTPADSSDARETMVGSPTDAMELLKPGLAKNLRIRVSKPRQSG